VPALPLRERVRQVAKVEINQKILQIIVRPLQIVVVIVGEKVLVNCRCDKT
jgi:hypothetical protein